LEKTKNVLHNVYLNEYSLVVSQDFRQRLATARWLRVGR